MLTPSCVVACARGWLGTRFHHQGRVKKCATHRGGVDCLGLLMGVAGELGLTLMDGRPITCLDRTDYPHHPDTAYLISQIEDALCPVAREAIRPGDIVLLRVDGSPQHLGIAGDAGNPISIIHAYAPAHAVVEHVLDEAWECRVQQVYRHPELFSH